MKYAALPFALLAAFIASCSSTIETGSDAPTESCSGLDSFRFPNGGDGHPDPFGAKAAGQARAGKLRESSQIVTGPFARQKPQVGDFALANDKIALYIEAENRTSGYGLFGGDILAIEPVGEDGKPKGLSQYNETLVVLSRQSVKADKVSVIADGSDGKAAIVRVTGVLTNIPFLDAFRVLAAAEYGFPAAVDYVLEPGAEKVTYRLSVVNPTEDVVDFSTFQRVGFFQTSRSKVFTERNGFAAPTRDNAFVAFDSGESGFVFRAAGGQPLNFELDVSGFQLFSLKGLSAKACETKTVDYLEIATGGPGIDGVLQAKRRAFGEPSWRELRGTLKEEGGAVLAGALVHATTPDGKYLTRAVTSETGEFLLHVPAGSVALTPTLKGWATPAARVVGDGEANVALELPKHATIRVEAKDDVTGEPLPVRVQVIAASPPAPAPAAFGLREELDGRIWQDFAMNGSTDLPVPPGTYRVIVSRGYEYELVDTNVTADSAKPAVVDAKLRHSVDSKNVMCADFHVHSFYSPDASDPVDEKVKSAVADGLEIPVSSEHEWVIDFQPVVARLGLTKWAFGMPSEELTTFTWGHFGVVPIYPKEDAPNNGAIDWVGKKPGEFFEVASSLAEKPVLIVNHPSGASGFQAYFRAASFDPKLVRGDAELWSDKFGAIEVFNDSSFDDNRDASVRDWFALLNAGYSFSATGASDSHDRRTTPVGYPRTCLSFGHDDPTKLTAETVRDVLRAGATTISGGLFLSVTGPGGIGPGGTSSPGEFSVVVQAPSWLNATSLEVIVDGMSVQTVPLAAVPSAPGSSPAKRYEANVNVSPAQSKSRHWVVFHAKGEGDLSPLHPKRKPFAVSNPIFF